MNKKIVAALAGVTLIFTPSVAFGAGDLNITGMGGPWVHVDNRSQPSMCSGTLVAPTKVLTAAHCFTGPGDNVRVRANNGSRFDWYGPANVVSIESFDGTWDFETNADTVLLTLSAPVPGTSTIPILNRELPHSGVIDIYGQMQKDNPVSKQGSTYFHGVGEFNASNEKGRYLADVVSNKGDSGGAWVYEGHFAGVTSGRRTTASTKTRTNHGMDRVLYDWLVARGVPAEPWNGEVAPSKPVGTDAHPRKSRFAGSDRVDTSLISLGETGGYDQHVVIATGRDYPDGLTGGVLAAEYGTSVILTMASGNQGLETPTLNILKDLSTPKATIIGGPGAVPETVAQSLRNIGVSVERIAGTNRYDTANQVMRKVLQKRGQNTPTKTYLVSGRNYPDALAAVPIVAKEKAIMVLAEGVDPSLVTGNSVCVGGPACNAHPAATRVVGADRYDTAYRVAEQMGCTHAGIAIGNNFADALSAGGYLAKRGGCMLLTNGHDVRVTPQTTQVTLFGGTGALPNGIRYYTE